MGARSSTRCAHTRSQRGLTRLDMSTAEGSLGGRSCTRASTRIGTGVRGTVQRVATRTACAPILQGGELVGLATLRGQSLPIARGHRRRSFTNPPA